MTPVRRIESACNIPLELTLTFYGASEDAEAFAA